LNKDKKKSLNVLFVTFRLTPTSSFFGHIEFTHEDESESVGTESESEGIKGNNLDTGN
jgi:hypothetical protein